MLGRLQNGTLKEVRVDSNGHLIMTGIQPANSIYTLSYDSIYATYPSDTQEVYTTYLNSAIQEIITIDYTNSAKNVLVSIVRS